MPRILRLALLALAAGSAAVRADDSPALNDFGGVGLIQTPTARFAPEGSFGGGISSIKPYNQIQIFATPLPWLEAVFRYTDVIDRPYGPASFSGDQSYKDRSFGFKLRLIEEGEHWPAVALGIQDFGGTGVFGGEYLVLSRRWYDVDLTLGLGWGRLGEGGDLRNPLTRLADRFDRDRTGTGTSTSTPGGSGAGRLFTGGTVGPFGGLQWHTPVAGLSLQLEYDGNDYSNERGTGSAVKQSMPVNIGADYAVSDRFHVGLGYERGERLSFRLSLRTNLETGRGPPKTLDPPAPTIVSRDPASLPASAPDTVETAEVAAIATRVADALAAQKFALAAFDLDPPTRATTIWIEQTRLRSAPQVTGRAVRATSGVLPPWVDRITVVGIDAGVESWRIAVNRAEFEKFGQFRGSPEEIRHGADLEPVQPGVPRADLDHLIRLPSWTWDTGPGFRQQIGGPDGFYFGQLLWRLSGDFRPTERLSFSGSLALNLLNNFEDIRLESNSQLPRVRSDIVEYLQQGQQGVTKLEANYIFSPASGLYARVSGGLFEEMYGGVAGEVLWRPHFQRWAMGLNANVVQQRDYAVRFNFRDYRVATGHLNLYYDFPWYRLKSKVSYGRYLAKDWGTTVEVAREFSSGATIGAFATFTDVPARVFGEGSFDKGFFVSLPFDLVFQRSTRRSVGFLFRPLTRDGGQKVRDGIDLYNATDAGNGGRVVADWADVVR
jgi:hypothetical protein